MTIEELIIYGKGKVHSAHAKMLLADMLDMNSLELLNHLEENVEESITKDYIDKINNLAKNEPIQYVIGNVNFYGYTYKVNKNVLIPRFETEELVANTIELIDKLFKGNISLIDLGTGSGNIGITLKKERPLLDVTLVDISEESLKVAKDNAINQEVEVTLIKSDMWSNITKKYNVVISNPPYIKNEEEIEDIVKENEPALALYGGKDGLDLYRKIINNIKDHLEEDYLIAFEIGYTQKDDVVSLLQKELKDITIITKKDLQDKDRMVFAYHIRN